jgi:hypothetical protein
MSIEHIIKFYPVDNADTAFIKLSDNTTILIDCQFRQDEENANGVKIFPIKEDLIKEVQKKNENPFIDLFILSHPHKDHCLGFGENFFTGDPKDYKDSNRSNKELMIGELWVTQKIFHNDIITEAEPIRVEAKRRRRMFENKESGWNSFGNILHIIGYNDEDKVVNGLHYVPGGPDIDFINGEKKDLFSIFIHSPFKSNLIQSRADEDENIASIVFQANFKIEKSGLIKTKLMMSGDSDHYVWKNIKEISEKKNRKEKLEWDIFLSPHHCSWSFFNDRPYEKNTTPKDYSLEILDYARDKNHSHIIASSVVIKDEKPNPPHYPAKLEYEKKIAVGNLKNTATSHSIKEPRPLIYKINENGFTLVKTIAAVPTITSNSYRAG